MFDKFFLKSKTIWGLIVILLVNIAPFIGLSFGQEDAETLNAAFEAIGTALGSILVVWGRITAHTNLSMRLFT